VFNVKKWILISFVVIVVGLVGLKYFTMQFDSRESAKVVHKESAMIEELSEKRDLASKADNIFIGEVIKETGIHKNSEDVQTDFSVMATQNIKGAIMDEITVSQQGGFYKNGWDLYVLKYDGIDLLEPGEMYLFCTTYDREKEIYNLIPRYGSVKVETEEQKFVLIDEFKAVLKK
jgi:hypothetical protein